MPPQGALGTASGRAAEEGWRAPGCRLDVDCGSARVRSHKISLSSSASSSPAMARPAGVIGPRASARRRSPGGQLLTSLSLRCTGANLTDQQSDGSSRAGRHTAWPGSASREPAGHGSKHEHRTPRETFSWIFVAGQKPYPISASETTVLWPFSKSPFCPAAVDPFRPCISYPGGGACARVSR
jgi:hypothetical protein